LKAIAIILKVKRDAIRTEMSGESFGVFSRHANGLESPYHVCFLETRTFLPKAKIVILIFKAPQKEVDQIKTIDVKMNKKGK